MKIIVCGDSFCADKHNNSWMHQLSLLLNATVNSYGQAGCSNYFISEQYKNNNSDQYEIAIIVKTEYRRVPYIKNMPNKCCLYFVERLQEISKFERLPENFKEAVKLYLEYFHNFELCKDISDYSLLKIINLKPQKQKIIWLSSTSNEDFKIFPIFNKNIPDNSIFIDGGLLNFVVQNEDKTTLNHLSPQNNYNLAVFLKDVILNENANRDLSKHNWTSN